jgi:cephalosporin hydroxylase
MPLRPLLQRFTNLLVYSSYKLRGTASHAPENYLLWYYYNRVWQTTSWLGIPTLKTPTDMWNYQEILVELKPSLVVEFGSCKGGSALFFSSILRTFGKPYQVFSVDIDADSIYESARQDPNIEFLTSSSVAPAVAERVRQLRAEYPGPVFAILDSDHSTDHVYAEMVMLRPLLQPGDCLIVEDTVINGHPLLPNWGPGPFEAVEKYRSNFPDDYTRDLSRENKFGFTFAPNGFWVRSKTV